MKVPSLIVTDVGSWTLQSTGMDEGPGEEPRQGFTGAPAAPGGARTNNPRPCSLLVAGAGVEGGTGCWGRASGAAWVVCPPPWWGPAFAPDTSEAAAGFWPFCILFIFAPTVQACSYF